MGLESRHGLGVQQEAVEDAYPWRGVCGGAGPLGDEGLLGVDEGWGYGTGTDAVLVFFGVEKGLGMGVSLRVLRRG